ncbi:hypothetical protein [Chromobacterium sp. IIBBL 290-4]|uniref:hypothetical protein n=1 Tax=Chromobacterium sp. IIBBL 290-4 TaxID=2953890 RepID=UPI0020B8DF91|nr:hypothetical protein [Chromobacterium sp. IIBBL 290-4]UTH72539.1 hypothetical protein NKT35_13360 [Chromobacterium sp. IIBBL 290-4]
MKKCQTIAADQLDAQLEQSLALARMARLSDDEVQGVSGGKTTYGPTTGFAPPPPRTTGFAPVQQ